MSELPIVSLLSSAQLQGVQGGAGTRGSTTTAPLALLTLPPGTYLSGKVVGRDGRGNPVLRTDKGDVVIKSDFFLKNGSEIVIRVEHNGDAFRARILSIDGNSPGQPPNTTQRPSLEEDAVIISTTSNSSAQEETDALPPASYRSSASNAVPQPAPARALLLNASPEAAEILKSLPKAIVASLPAPLPAQSPIPSGSTINVVPLPATGTSTIPAATPASTAAEPSPAIAGALPAQKPAPSPASASLVSKLYNVFQNVAPNQPAGSAAPAPLAAQIPAGPITEPVVSTQTPATLVSSAATPLIQQNASAPQAPAQSSPPLQPIQTPITSASETPSAPLIAPSGYNASPPTATTPQASSNFHPATQPLLPPAPTPQELAKGIIPARIISTQNAQEIILQTPIGTLKLPADALPHVTQGQDIKLQLTSFAPTNTSNPSISYIETEQSLPGFSLLRTVSELVQTLQAINPQLAADVVERALPKVGPKIGADLLFFLSALRGGNVQDWIGQDAHRTLVQKGQIELLQRLAGELTNARNAFLDPPPTPTGQPAWQALLFPVWMQGEIQLSRLFLKKDKEEEQKDKKKKGGGTRFIIEVGLSELGEMQLDGLVRKQEEHTLFDLIIRSHNTIPSAMQQDIIAIYHEAADITGFQGSVQFNATKTFPVNPMEEITQSHHTIIA